MRKHLLTSLFFLFIVLLAADGFGQKIKKAEINSKKHQTLDVNKASNFDISEPLKDMAEKSLLKFYRDNNLKPKVSKNKFPEKPKKGMINAVPDPLGQQQRGYSSAKAAEDLLINANFDGADQSDNSSGIAPPDTDGDVSPDFYVQAINNVTSIYDRDGNVITAPFNTSAFWSGFSDGSGGYFDETNDGDPIVLWDETAGTDGRWVVTQFAVPHTDGNYYELIAISQTSDPTGAYYRYAFQFNDFNDYPKFGIWPDAYYCGQNSFNPSTNASTGAYLTAFERDEMIAGNPAARMVNIQDASLFAVFPADADELPPLGTPGIFISDQVATYTGNDEVYIYEFDVDWTTPANSTFGLSQTLTVTPYGFFSSDTEAEQKSASDKLDLLH